MIPSPQDCTHEWEQMHHLDDAGRHYCPTGFATCQACGETKIDEGAQPCHLWGEFKNP